MLDVSKNNKFLLYSFDVFDTLITRRVATPEGIFAIIQHILKTDDKYSDIPQDVKENYFYYRKDSEHRQRAFNRTNYDDKDVTLSQIYDDMKATHALTEEQRAFLMDLEINTEIANVLSIKENIGKINKLLEDGKRVILISDMYLPKSVISQMFAKVAPELNQLKLYLSSDCGFMKVKKGELFKYVQKQEDIEYSKWCHIGDNWVSDCVNPQKLGIRVFRYKFNEFKFCEKKIIENQSQNPIIQLMIGCAKFRRLNSCSEKYSLGSSIAGMVFYPYVNWVLEQAQRRGISYLCFLARDGYIFKQIADLLIEKRNLDIKTEYVYGSKKAWRIPSLDIENSVLKKQFVQTLVWNYKNMDKTLGITIDELLSFLPEEFKGFKRGLSRRKVNALKDWLLKDVELLSYVSEKASLRKNNALSYLKQVVGNSQGREIAFVDIDGSHFSMNCMSSLIHEFRNKELFGFYLAGTPVNFEGIGINYSHFYNFRKVNLGHVLELLARAPHGQTLDYQQNYAKWEPVLENIDPELFNSWGFEEYVAGILDFSNDMDFLATKYNNLGFVNYSLIKEYIDFVVNNVDRELASLLGDIHHTLKLEENSSFAPEISVFKALCYLFTGKFRTESLSYSKARSSRLARFIANLREEIFDAYIHKSAKIAYIKLLGVKVSFRHLLWKEL